MKCQSFLLPAACVASAVAGWAAHSTHTVQAAEASAGSVQIQGNGPDARITLYDERSHRIFIYERALTGINQVHCSYQLHFDRPGTDLQRQNCDIGTLH